MRKWTYNPNVMAFLADDGWLIAFSKRGYVLHRGDFASSPFADPMIASAAASLAPDVLAALGERAGWRGIERRGVEAALGRPVRHEGIPRGPVVVLAGNGVDVDPADVLVTFNAFATVALGRRLLSVSHPALAATAYAIAESLDVDASVWLTEKAPRDAALIVVMGGDDNTEAEFARASETYPGSATWPMPHAGGFAERLADNRSDVFIDGPLQFMDQASRALGILSFEPRPTRADEKVRALASI